MTNEMEVDMKYREFVVRGRVYSGNRSHATHSIYWALRNSEWDSEILINDIEIKDGEKE